MCELTSFAHMALGAQRADLVPPSVKHHDWISYNMSSLQLCMKLASNFCRATALALYDHS